MGGRQRHNAVPDLKILDGAGVFVLVDNVSDGLSSVPDGVTNEMEDGAETFSVESLCFACFGIALVVTGQIGDRKHTVLFDAGPNGVAIEHNGRVWASTWGLSKLSCFPMAIPITQAVCRRQSS